MMKKVLYFSLILMFSTQIFAQKVQWRGENRDGIYPSTGLLDEWPEEGPELLWHFDKLGKGYSSVAVTDDKIITTGMEEDNTGFVYALNHKGKLLWKKAYGKEWTDSFEGTRTTPMIDGDRMYFISAFGKVFCMNVNAGTIVWEKDVLTELDGVNIKWGITENLLVEDGKVICTPGGENANVVALDKKTGDVIWKCAGKGEISAYCSPQIIDLGVRKLLVTHTKSKILGIDFKTGKLLWSHDQPNKWSVHANTPIYHDGHVYCFSGYGKGGVLLQLSDDGSSKTEVWRNETMASRMGGAILMDGRIYGSGDVDKSWQCLDWDTGKVLYKTTEIGNGTVSAADGKLYCYSERGELAMLIPQENSFKVAGKIRVPHGSMQHWAHLVIKDGILYLRHGNSLMAYNIKK